VSRGKLVVILSGFPRRSETFALNELLALEASGAVEAIFATKLGDCTAPHPGSERLLDRVQVLPPESPAELATVVARRLAGRAVAGIHGYFAHLPAQVARLVAERLGVPYGFSVHARDARKDAPGEFAARARGAACVIACNQDVAQDVRRSGADVQVAPHGVDTQRFRPRPLPDGGPVQILAVGRLVEKKGFDILVTAAARLSVPFRLRIIGEGPEQGRLAAAVASAKLEDRVTLCGGRTHAELPEEYSRAHVVAVPSIVDATGDRDGLPNVVLEAMASGRPVVASDVGAISSAVTPGETGILVPPGDPGALCRGLESIARQPALGERLGRGGRHCVERHFELGRCAERLERLLEAAYG
jgi:glycosyltransferase involved in cell wall biosynthesis